MSQKKFFNLRLPFFLPLWRRLLTTGVLAGWTGVEIWGENIGWAILFGAGAAYTAYEFFIAFDPAHYEDKADD